MKQALVVGGARSGKYTALLLKDVGYAVTLTDINQVEYKNDLEAKEITVVDGGHPDFLLDVQYDLVIKNPGIKYSAPFIKKLLSLDYQIISEVDFALSLAKDYQVFAITGTNGKTTTTTLLYQMLKKQYKRAFVGGNIGIPVSEVVYKNGLEKAYLALEVSSFQLDGIYKLKPFVSNITNLKEDHLDFYPSVSDYYKSKQRVYQNQDKNDYMLVNCDDNLVLDYLNNDLVNKITYSLTKDSDVALIDNQVIYKDIVLFDVSKIKLMGSHNIYNGMVAAVMAYLGGVDIEIIREVMHSFTGVEHRIEYVDKINEVLFYNDSKATNIESTIVAINSFVQPVILIAGGYDKHISFDDLKAYQDQIKAVILFGETKYKLQEIFKDAILCDSLSEAVSISKNIAKPKDVVLFSPACASFDMFKDYEERGHLFIQYVKSKS